MSFNVSLILLACSVAAHAGKSAGNSQAGSWLTPEGRIVEKSRLSKSVLKRLTTPRPAAELDNAGRNGISDYKFQIAKPGEKLVKPLCELTYSVRNIEGIREEARNNPKLKPLIDSLLKQVKPWLKLTDKELKALVPSPDATIAAPTIGDPKVNKALPSMSGQEFLGRGDRKVMFCTIKKPGCIYSPNTKEWYGNEKAGEKYYDSGKGWVREDGKRFYFKGYWNLWVLIEMHRTMDNLALLYMLSGDEILARRALQILDLLSDLRKKRNPDTCYLGIYTKLPRPGKGFLAFNGNHANGRQILTGISLDLLANSKYAAAPSIIDSNLTIFEAARRHYFQLFELGYLGRSLQNHALVLYGNIATQGVLFGYPSAVKLGIEAVYAYLDVCVYRDGDYYETADGYGRIGKRYIYQTMQPLNHYNPSRYDSPRLFPQPVDYPFNLKFGNSTRWFNNAVEAQFRMNIYGRNFRFGDTTPDRVWGANDSLKKWTDKEKAQFVRILAVQTDNKAWQEKCRQLFDQMRESPFSVPDEYSVKTYGESQWFYLAPPQAKKVVKDSSKSMLTPGRLLITLKSGEGKNERGVFCRGGVPTSHGHDDQMGIQLYGRGGCMTGFYGYGRGGTARPDFWGYSVKAISHQMATINEDLPKSYIFKKTGTAADVLSFMPVPPAQCFELSNPGTWKRQGGKEYRRLVWLIDVDKDDFYMVDIFRLGGGWTHDYIRFAPYLDRPSPDSLKITGVTPMRIPGVWSLAGMNPRYKNKVFNKPGKSWAERMQISGYMKDLGLKSEKRILNKSRWNPDPGNGYGFIYDVRGAKTDNDWLCEWKMPRGIPYKQRLYMVNYDGQTAIRAKAPAEKNFSANYEVVLARRTKGRTRYLRSRFVAVSELAKPDSWIISKVTKAKVQTGGNPEDVVALWVELSDGRRDLIISCAKATMLKIDDIKFSGQKAFLRFDSNNKLECLTMEASAGLSVNGLTIVPERAVWSAKVDKTFAGILNNQVVINKKFPESLVSSTVLFDNKGKVPYSHNDYYKLAGVDGNTLKLGAQSLIGVHLEVESVAGNGVVNVRWPNELVGRFNFDYFLGRKVSTLDGKRAGIIVKQKNNKTFTVRPANLFKSGDKLQVWMVKAGDTVSMPSWVNVKKIGDEYKVRANTPLRLVTPQGSKHIIDAKELAKTTVSIKAK
jgi:hypothetical protein